MKNLRYSDFDKFIIFIFGLIFIIALLVSSRNNFSHSALWGLLFIATLFLPILRRSGIKLVSKVINIWIFKHREKKSQEIQVLRKIGYDDVQERYLWLAYGELFCDQNIKDTMFDSYIAKQKSEGISKFRLLMNIYFLIPRAFSFQSLALFVTSGASLEPDGWKPEYVMYQKKKWGNAISLLNFLNPFWYVGFIVSVIYFNKVSRRAKKQLLIV